MHNTVAGSVYTQYPLPSTAENSEGYKYIPTEDQWRIVSTSRVFHWNFQEIRGVVSNELLHLIKYVFFRLFSDDQAIGTSHSSYYELKRFLIFLRRTRENPIEEISLEGVLAFKATLRRDEEFHLAILRTFFKEWVDRDIPLVGLEIHPVLKQFRLRNARTGHIVGNRHNGRFSDAEWDSIEKAIVLDIGRGIGDGTIVSPETLALKLLYDLGCRPASLCWLKVCDLQCTPGVGLRQGTTEYQLWLPLPKKVGKLAREVLTRKPLMFETGELIRLFIQDQKKRYQHLGLGDQLPLFVCETRNDNPPGFLHHYLSADLDRVLKKAFIRMGLKKEGVDELLHFTTYRFRYTLGTLVARETNSPKAVAAVLNHEDDRCAKNYTDWVRTADPKIDEASARAFGPRFKKFCGHNPEEQESEDERPRVSMPKSPKESLGKCGRGRGCALHAPKACLICPHFHPQLRARWGDMLRDLIAEQDWIIKNTPYQEEVPNLLRAHGDLIWACADIEDRCLKRIQTIGVMQQVEA